MDLYEYTQRIPKVELHVHLEGSIRPQTLLRLAERNQVHLPAANDQELRDYYKFKDFDHFIEVYMMITSCLKTADDYTLIAYEFGSDCHRQNVRYAEVTFTIQTNASMTGLPWQSILDGLNIGRGQAQRDFGVDWQWVFDIVRNQPDTQGAVVDIALAARDQGVVALGLGGNEIGYPADLFVDSFNTAISGGLFSVPHAGELTGAHSVWSAIELLHANRIGHGVRSIDDPQLVRYLREHQIALEICPTSNICLGVYSDYAHHPLRQLWDAGVHVTVNSDDPPLFNTDLNQEYRVLVEHFNFTADELERISLNAIQASFLDSESKTRLIFDFNREFDQLRPRQNQIDHT